MEDGRDTSSHVEGGRGAPCCVSVLDWGEGIHEVEGEVEGVGWKVRWGRGEKICDLGVLGRVSNRRGFKIGRKEG